MNLSNGASSRGAALGRWRFTSDRIVAFQLVSNQTQLEIHETELSMSTYIQFRSSSLFLVLPFPGFAVTVLWLVRLNM